MWILFGQLLNKIGLLITPTSGHTDCNVSTGDWKNGHHHGYGVLERLDQDGKSSVYEGTYLFMDLSSAWLCVTVLVLFVDLSSI